MAKAKLYYWQALNSLQQKQRGMIIAPSLPLAQQRLFQQGLRQVKLQRNWQLFHSLKTKEIGDFFIQLAALLNATVPLNQSLRLLWQHSTNLALYQWLESVLSHIENGLPFSQALQNKEQYLTPQEQQLIQTAELTGQLAKVCQQIALQRQQQLRLHQKLQKILIYPLVVLAISLGLTLLLLWFIVPQFALIYQNNASLPFFTQLLLNVSHYLQQYGLISLVIISLLALLWLKFGRKSHLWQQQKIKLVARIPLINQLSANVRLVRFCQSLGLMLQANIPIQQALQSFLPQNPLGNAWQKTALTDPILQPIINQALVLLQQGYSFAESMGTALFPAQAQKMLQIGEKTGQIVAMLTQIEQYYQRQVEHKIDLLAQLLEPCLMLLIGSLIGMIMLGMYLPMFNMGQLL